MSVTSRRPGLANRGLSVDTVNGDGPMVHRRAVSSANISTMHSSLRPRTPGLINTNIASRGITTGEQRRPESPLDRPRVSPMPINMMRRNSLGRYSGSYTNSIREAAHSPVRVPSPCSSPAFNIDGSHPNPRTMGENMPRLNANTNDITDTQLVQLNKSLRGENRRLKHQNGELQKSLVKVESELEATKVAQGEAVKKADHLAKRREKDHKSFQKHLANIEKISGLEIEKQRTEIQELRERIQKKDIEAHSVIKKLKEEHKESIDKLGAELNAMKSKCSQHTTVICGLEKQLADAVNKIKELEASNEHASAVCNSLVELEARCASQQRLISHLQAENEEARLHLTTRQSFIWDSIDRQPSSAALRSKLSRMSMMKAPGSNESFASSFFNSDITKSRNSNRRNCRMLHQRSKSEILITMADIFGADETSDPLNGVVSVVGRCNLRPIPSVSDYGSQRLSERSSKAMLGSLTTLNPEKQPIKDNAVHKPNLLVTSQQAHAVSQNKSAVIAAGREGFHRRVSSMPNIYEYTLSTFDTTQNQHSRANKVPDSNNVLHESSEISAKFPASYPLPEGFGDECKALAFGTDPNHVKEENSPLMSQNKRAQKGSLGYLHGCIFIMTITVITYILFGLPLSFMKLLLWHPFI
ncbi:hypothetical protein H4219_000672 [Mycoemilia scoparia]|uniref:Uncharacterized protein n=1 Tax=Mycoemilia scoparia TaxID=417184 RepID=A0A9W8A2D0_9FUNG|nr:hypothetical protein H4219_000672 [Mycoemilia scoparia]